LLRRGDLTDNPSQQEDVVYICICNAVTEKAVRECARNGVCSVDELALELGVGAGCGRCRECASELLRDVRTAEPLAAAA
jgi:bacterioferritin-associated ferredoxin